MNTASEKDFEKARPLPVITKKEAMEDIKVPSTSGVVSIDVEKFIKFASISKTIKFGEMELVLKTLQDCERDAALAPVKIQPDESVASYIDKIKKPLLSYAIVRIGASEFSSDEHRAMLLDYLNKAQGATVDKLWSEYEILLSEQQEVLGNEELKKK